MSCPFAIAGLLHWVLLCAAATAAAPAHPEEAWLRIDLERGEVQARGAERELSFSVDGVALRARLVEVVDAFARGEDPRDERVALGRLILAPLAPILSTTARWRVQASPAEAVPGALAPLCALVLPWDAQARPVASRHAVVFAWPPPSEGSAVGERAPGASAGKGMLLVAPFARGVEPAADDPDTLRRALRAGAARVDLLPRNEGSAAAVRRALEDSAAPVLWLRATPAQVVPLGPAFEAFPSLVIWSLPAREPTARIEVGPHTLHGDGPPPVALIVQTWPHPETGLAPACRALADGLARGLSAADAVSAMQREAAAAGDPPSGWAAFAVLGEPDHRVRISRAPWLRRLSSPH